MPKQKDLKRLVRTRMAKTGESYTAARTQVLRKRAPTSTKPASPSSTLAVIAGMSDASVRAKTGKNWLEWTHALDAIGAASLPHREIAARLHADFAVGDWWAQMVTVGYERIRGLREKGQRRDGGYEVSKSKTFGVPLARLYAAFAERRRWLGDIAATVRRATDRKSMRLTWPDGTKVEAMFFAKGEGKSMVAIAHGGLETRAAADRLRTFWGERLAVLAELLSEKR
jgi:hypothetical protein